MPRFRIQWFFDLSTVAGQTQIITVKSGGTNLVKRLNPFFAAYKYYKLGKVSVKMIPASTLPIDPTGLSYEAGENTVDPRDQLTPGLTRITNGEDCLDDITGLSEEEQRKLYYTMMLDPRWFKWSLQSGLKRSARPLYWQIGQYHQDYYPGATLNVPNFITGASPEVEPITMHAYAANVTGSTGTGTNFRNRYERDTSDPRGLFQVGHKGRIGWLPTDGLLHAGEAAGMIDLPHIATPAVVELFKIIMPPAIKTRYYYRVFVTEECFFKDPVLNQLTDFGYRSIDRFVMPKGISEILPTQGSNPTFTTPSTYGPVQPNGGDKNGDY